MADVRNAKALMFFNRLQPYTSAWIAVIIGKSGIEDEHGLP